VSVLLSILAGWLFSQASNQALWEGILALVAAASVASLTVHMWRTARRIKGEIEGQLQKSTQNAGRKAWIGVFLFTLLMISREGMETALLMGTLIFQVRAIDIILGAVAGTLPAIFLLIFVVQLVIYGFHELTEANLFPGSEALHWATEPYGPDGVYGQYLTYLLIALPLGWLLVSMVKGGAKIAAKQA
jgi:high-affinity iron transporter